MSSLAPWQPNTVVEAQAGLVGILLREQPQVGCQSSNKIKRGTTNGAAQHGVIMAKGLKGKEVAAVMRYWLHLRGWIK